MEIWGHESLSTSTPEDGRAESFKNDRLENTHSYHMICNCLILNSFQAASVNTPGICTAKYSMSNVQRCTCITYYPPLH